MKKYFMIAMTAVVLMACGSKSESTGLPKAEEKALEAATVEAIDQLGESPETVDAALVKAGFKQAEIALPEFGKVPARMLKKAPAAKSEATYGDAKEVSYVYGLPDNYKSMSDAQIMSWMVQRIVGGNPIIIVMVNYVDNKMANMGTSVVLAKNDKSNKVYTATSENLYSKLPSDEKKYTWEGEIEYRDETKENMNYDDHSAYVAAVAKAEGIDAYEQATVVTEGSLYNETADGYMYHCGVINPSAQEEAEQLKRGAPTALVMQSYSISKF